MEKSEKTTIQIDKETLQEFNKKKYEAMAKQGSNLSNDEFLKKLLESFA